MKKQVYLITLLLIVVALLLLSFFSTGFTDFVSKVTGKVSLGETMVYQSDFKNTEPNYEEFCNETDNGQDYFNMGITTNADGPKEDYCYGGSSLLSLPTNLVEYYCFDNIEIAEEDLECEFGCLFGACLDEELPETACLDTDKQNDPFVYGSVFKIEEAHPDECIDDTTLMQYYCAGEGEIGSLTTICEAGCNVEKGICFDGGTTTTGSECYDNDPLNDIYEYGSVISGLELKEDQCISSPNSGNLIIQYECSPEGEITMVETSSCGENCKDEDGNSVECGCSFGACESPSVTYYCNDSDGIDFLNQGSRTIDGGSTFETDYCPEEGGVGVMEYFCMNPPNYLSGGNPHNSVQDCRWLDEDGNPTLSQQNLNNYCSEGRCVLDGEGYSGGDITLSIEDQTFFQKVGSFFKKIF